MGGLTKEWLEMVVRKALDPDSSLFNFSSDQNNTVRHYIHSSTNPKHLKYFQYLGKILGLAIMSNYNVGAKFDRSVFKYILNKTCYLEDVKIIDPQIYNSSVYIKYYHILKLSVMKFIDLTVEEIDLIPN